MQYHSYSDLQLWQLYREGDALAADALARRYIPALHRLAERYAPALESDDDHYGIAYEAMLNAFASYNPAKGKSLATHILWCARYYLRRAYCPPPVRVLSLEDQAFLTDDTCLLADLLPSPTESPEETAVANWERQHLRQALASMPERWRRLLVLQYIYELADPEIATILGVSISRVHQLRHKALAALRQALHPSYQAVPDAS